ncbi:hypothetical protein THIX_10176 [Thiomonas sp. X19]|nr:hypothetical protein THIX_10176 [Thiomonas sp. X19]
MQTAQALWTRTHQQLLFADLYQQKSFPRRKCQGRDHAKFGIRSGKSRLHSPKSSQNKEKKDQHKRQPAQDTQQSCPRYGIRQIRFS